MLEHSYRQLSREEIKIEFLRQISHAYTICSNDDVDLILRDHSHTDFCLGAKPSDVCPLIDYLGSDYKLLSVLTVRHPLDSYLGLLAQKWEQHFFPSTLEEYSLRYLAFLDRYTGIPLRRYEDLCKDPEAFMEEICDLLEIGYSPDFIQYFGGITLSGGSGRERHSIISRPPRRMISNALQEEAEASTAFDHLMSRLGYHESFHEEKD
jgi:hypothetical protein